MITTNNKISEWSMLCEPLLLMLLDESKNDPYLAEGLRRSDKNMEECCERIYKVVQSKRNGQKCVCISDADVVALAKEYFLNDVKVEESDAHDTDESDEPEDNND